MRNKNKGYMLAESIIAITVVATVITIIFALIMNNYIKQDNEVTKFNTTQDLYVDVETQKLLQKVQPIFIQRLEEEDYINIMTETQEDFYNEYDIETYSEKLDIRKLYFMKYNKTSLNNLINNETLPKIIKKELKNYDIEDNKCNYRYLIVYNDYSYSTIGVDCEN